MDITSLDWNPQGTLVAVGGFDSIVRIWTKSGDEYMTNPQHRVRAFLNTATYFNSYFFLFQGFNFPSTILKIRAILIDRISLDGTTCVWEVATKTLAMQYRCHSSNASFVFIKGTPSIYTPFVSSLLPGRRLDGRRSIRVLWW